MGIRMVYNSAEMPIALACFTIQRIVDRIYSTTTGLRQMLQDVYRPIIITGSRRHRPIAQRCSSESPPGVQVAHDTCFRYV